MTAVAAASSDQERIICKDNVTTAQQHSGNKTTTTTSTTTNIFEEIRWTDDSIRWEGGLHLPPVQKRVNEQQLQQQNTIILAEEMVGHMSTTMKQETEKESDNDEEDYYYNLIDPFKDPNPFEIFTFQFQLPNNSTIMNKQQQQQQHETTTAHLGDQGGRGEEEENENKKMCASTSHNNNNNAAIINIHLRGYKTDADEVWQSTGLTLWRASHYLCEYQLEQHYTWFFSNNKNNNNQRILELGAGLGLNGILAWKQIQQAQQQLPLLQGDNNNGDRSSSHVCITDGDSDALAQLRDNVNRNRTSSVERMAAATATITANTNDSDNDPNIVSCHQLIWGEESATKFLSQIAQNQQYDFILASDIIYSLVIVKPLWETIQVLLKKEGGKFIMAYAKREVPVSIDLVLKASMEHGFSYKLVKEDATDGVWVYEFSFRPSSCG